VTAVGDSYQASAAREVEQLAIRVLRGWLGNRGVLMDQSSTGEVDFAIAYSDGRRAVGEITWNEDPATQKMWKAN
jgi:hypothetical protein